MASDAAIVAGEPAPDVVEPVQFEREIGLQKIKVTGKADLPDAFVDHRLDCLEVGKISDMHGALVQAVQVFRDFFGVGRRNQRVIPQLNDIPLNTLQLGLMVGVHDHHASAR